MKKENKLTIICAITMLQIPIGAMDSPAAQIINEEISEIALIHTPIQFRPIGQKKVTRRTERILSPVECDKARKKAQTPEQEEQCKKKIHAARGKIGHQIGLLRKQLSSKNLEDLERKEIQENLAHLQNEQTGYIKVYRQIKRAGLRDHARKSLDIMQQKIRADNVNLDDIRAYNAILKSWNRLNGNSY